MLVLKADRPVAQHIRFRRDSILLAEDEWQTIAKRRLHQQQRRYLRDVRRK
jgi:hypothetical protein